MNAELESCIVILKPISIHQLPSFGRMQIKKKCPSGVVQITLCNAHSQRLWPDGCLSWHCFVHEMSQEVCTYWAVKNKNHTHRVCMTGNAS